MHLQFSPLACACASIYVVPAASHTFFTTVFYSTYLGVYYRHRSCWARGISVVVALIIIIELNSHPYTKQLWLYINPDSTLLNRRWRECWPIHGVFTLLYRFDTLVNASNLFRAIHSFILFHCTTIIACLLGPRSQLVGVLRSAKVSVSAVSLSLRLTVSSPAAYIHKNKND